MSIVFANRRVYTYAKKAWTLKMHTVYFSYQDSQSSFDRLDSGTRICVRSLLWGEQWFYSFEQLINDLKDEGVPYQLIDVDMLSDIPAELMEQGALQ